MGYRDKHDHHHEDREERDLEQTFEHALERDLEHELEPIQDELREIANDLRFLNRSHFFIITQNQGDTPMAGSSFNPDPSQSANANLITGAAPGGASGGAPPAPSTGKPPVQGLLPGLAPGKTGTLTATLYDGTGALTKLPEGVVPTWTSSDNDNAPLEVAADGLSAKVTVPATDTKALPATITITAKLPSGAEATGTCLLPLLYVAPQTFSFIIAQS